MAQWGRCAMTPSRGGRLHRALHGSSRVVVPRESGPIRPCQVEPMTGAHRGCVSNDVRNTRRSSTWNPSTVRHMAYSSSPTSGATRSLRDASRVCATIRKPRHRAGLFVAGALCFSALRSACGCCSTRPRCWVPLGRTRSQRGCAFVGSVEWYRRGARLSVGTELRGRARNGCVPRWIPPGHPRSSRYPQLDRSPA